MAENFSRGWDFEVAMYFVSWLGIQDGCVFCLVVRNLGWLIILSHSWELRVAEYFVWWLET